MCGKQFKRVYQQTHRWVPDFFLNASIVLNIFYFAQSFDAFYCCFMPRQFNCVANTLAKYAISFGSHVWTNSPPLFLETVLSSYLS